MSAALKTEGFDRAAAALALFVQRCRIEPHPFAFINSQRPAQTESASQTSLLLEGEQTYGWRIMYIYVDEFIRSSLSRKGDVCREAKPNTSQEYLSTISRYIDTRHLLKQMDFKIKFQPKTQPKIHH